MKCNNCGGEHIEVMAEIITSFPFEWYYNLTKKKMQSKNFRVWGVNWGKASYICKDCGYTLKFGEDEGEKKNE